MGKARELRQKQREHPVSSHSCAWFGRSFQRWQIGCQDLGSGESLTISLSIPFSWSLPLPLLPGLLELQKVRTQAGVDLWVSRGDVPDLQIVFILPFHTHCLGTRRAKRPALLCGIALGRGITSQKSAFSSKFNKSYSFALPRVGSFLSSTG